MYHDSCPRGTLHKVLPMSHEEMPPWMDGPPPDEGYEHHAQGAQEPGEGEPDPGVLRRLKKHKKKLGDGEVWIVSRSLENIAKILEHDPRWVGRLRENEMRGAIEMDGEEMGDIKIAYVRLWIERVYGVAASIDHVMSASMVIARRNQYHPVREYLSGLTWDGVPRVRGFLASYLRAVMDDEYSPELVATLSGCFFIAAVARAMQPGCKVDTTLILVGAQGALKSTAIAALCDDPSWFCDTELPIGTKDTFEQLQGVWIYEIAEMDAIRKADAPKVKALLSSCSDRWRRPYGRVTETRKRGVVFVGTTNKNDVLYDETGSRRFWPVAVGSDGQLNIDRIRADRDQLWAEAVELYRQGERWWLDPEMAAKLAAASERYQDRHIWHDRIAEYVATRAWVTTAEVLTQAVGRRLEDATPRDPHAIAQVLRSMGWTSRQGRKDGEKIRFWERPS